MVEKLIPRAAAHNVQLVVLLSSVSFQLCKGFRIALCKAAIGAAEIVADAEKPPAGRRIKGGLHALGSEKFRRVGNVVAHGVSADPIPFSNEIICHTLAHSL